MAVFSLCFAISVIFSMAVSADVQAQTQLDPVVVTATREPTTLTRITSDVVLIDAQRIRNSTADSVEDLLRREAGLQVGRNGGPGKSGGYSIRGSNANSTLVLIDGVRVGSATLGQAELESLSLAQVERIEVLRGPGSSLYGADAVGGVIQIFTRRGEAGLRISGSAAVGGYGSRQADVSLSGAQSGFDYAVGLGVESSKGVSTLKPGDQFGNYNPDADGYRRNAGQLNLGYTLAPGHRLGLKLVQSKLNSQYDDSEYAAPNFAQDATPDFRSLLDSQVLAVDYRGQINAALSTSLQWARNKDDLLSGAASKSRYFTQRQQITSQSAYKIDSTKQLVLVFERLDERAEADSYAAPVKRNNNALVLGYSGQYGAAGAQSLQADLRQDQNSVYGGVTTGRLGWSVEVASGLKLRALAGTTFRAPSFNDLYYPGYGVNTVVPERGRSIEAGVSWRNADAEASATFYRNKVRDLIGYESDRSFCPADPAYDYGCARNISAARLQGATLAASKRIGALSLQGSVDFLDAKNSTTGRRLNRRAANQTSASADYEMGTWKFGVAVQGVGARPDGSKQLSAYETLDLRGTWRVAPDWQLEAKLLNASDRQYESVRDYQNLGRQVWLGVRFDGKGL